VETLEREEYEAILKVEGVVIQDVFREMREKEKRLGDPTKTLELTPETDTLADTLT
jgi:hypothetical protein